MKNFKEKIFEIVKNISPTPEAGTAGRVLTYKEVAELAGRPKAYRVVGNILNTNYDPSIPCHRVVRSDGKIGGYNRGLELKKTKLVAESVELIFS